MNCASVQHGRAPSCPFAQRPCDGEVRLLAAHVSFLIPAPLHTVCRQTTEGYQSTAGRDETFKGEYDSLISRFRSERGARCDETTQVAAYSLPPSTQPPSWRTTPCRLSATAYSIHSQLPSMSAGRLLHPQPEDAPCRDGDYEWWIAKDLEEGYCGPRSGTVRRLTQELRAGCGKAWTGWNSRGAGHWVPVAAQAQTTDTAQALALFRSILRWRFGYSCANCLGDMATVLSTWKCTELCRPCSRGDTRCSYSATRAVGRRAAKQTSVPGLHSWFRRLAGARPENEWLQFIYQDNGLLVCSAVSSHRSCPTFQRCLLPSSSGRSPAYCFHDKGCRPDDEAVSTSETSVRF
jgi:hypothetical protein